MTTNELTWHQLPADAGQIVDVTYAVDWESETLYRRTHDRSDGARSIEAAEIIGGEFEPWNGILPSVGEWRDVTTNAVEQHLRRLGYRVGGDSWEWVVSRDRRGTVVSDGQISCWGRDEEIAAALATLGDDARFEQVWDALSGFESDA